MSDIKTAKKESIERVLPDAELDIMRVIWSSDTPLCASEIAKRLSESRTWTTATAHVLLGRLCERGYISCDRSNFLHRFTALVTEDEYRKTESKSFLRRIACGSVRNMVASLIETERLTDDDIDELTALLANKRDGND